MITVYEQNLGVLCNHKGLVTNYEEGGGYKMGGGQVRFYPYEEGERPKKFKPCGKGAEKVLG